MLFCSLTISAYVCTRQIKVLWLLLLLSFCHFVISLSRVLNKPLSTHIGSNLLTSLCGNQLVYPPPRVHGHPWNHSLSILLDFQPLPTLQRLSSRYLMDCLNSKLNRQYTIFHLYCVTFTLRNNIVSGDDSAKKGT